MTASIGDDIDDDGDNDHHYAMNWAWLLKNSYIHSSKDEMSLNFHLVEMFYVPMRGVVALTMTSAKLPPCRLLILHLVVPASLIQQR